MRKNVAGQNVAVQMNSRTDGSPLTTGVSAFVTGDNGTRTAGGGTLTHKGDGQWNYAPTQAESNFNHIAFGFTHTTGVNQAVNVYTVSFDPHDTAGLGLTRIDAAITTRLAPTVAGRTLAIETDGMAHADVKEWLGVAPNVLIAGRVDADMTAISGDAPAADNLEAMFDGTGYANNFAPSTQQQVAALAAGVSGFNVGASNFTLTTGTQVNTFTATISLGGLSHELSDTAGTFDGFYEFDIGPLGVPVILTAIMRVFSSNDIWFVQGFNWSLSQWENIRQVDGKNQTTFDSFTITLFQRFAGTGANLGKVRIRMFTDTGTTSTMFVDQLVMTYIQQDNEIIRAGLAQGGGADFIDLDAGADANDNFYRPSLVRIVTGAGAGQVRRADSYNGTTKRLTVATPWIVNPDATSQFEIRPWASVRVSDVDPVPISDIATGYLDLTDGIESGITPRQGQRVMLAAMAGKSSQHELGTPKYRNQADTKNRIDATTDANGNRTAVTLDTT